MGYNVSGLPAYVDQTGKLIHRSVFGVKSAKILNQMPNVKGSASLNIFDEAVTFQAGGCGFSAVDSTTLTQRTLTVGYIKSDKSWCPDTLNGVYAQYLLKPGSYQDEVPFEQDLLGFLADIVAQQIETAIWQGDTGSGTNNLSYFDGLLKIINAASGSTVNITASGITTSNVIAVLNGVYNVIPVQVLAKPDLRILVGFDTYRTFTQALTTANLYNYVADTASDFEMYLPGTNVKIVALNGLNGTGKIVAARLSNLVYGFDLEADSAEAKIWFSQDNQEVRGTIKFKAGTQIAFPAEIVFFH